MVKRKIALLLAVMMTALICAMPAGAASQPALDEGVVVMAENGSSTTYFEDGSYLVTSIVEQLPNLARFSAVSGSRYAEYYSSQGICLWRYTIWATFHYDGYSSVCIDATHRVDIWGEGWSATYVNISRDGNRALGNATMKYKMLGITLKTVDQFLEISCDPRGLLY